MSMFTEKELAYLHPDPEERRLGRLATIGSDGMPHVAPVGWSHNADHDTIGKQFGRTVDPATAPDRDP